MDTSEQYIKMRIAAIPDLGMGIPPLKLSRFYTELVWVDSKGDWYFSDGGDATQLERQDQLQEIWLRFRNYDANGKEYVDQAGTPQLLDNLHYFHFDESQAGYAQSMEQLWLAFVEKEKFGKVWSGEYWKKED